MEKEPRGSVFGGVMTTSGAKRESQRDGLRQKKKERESFVMIGVSSSLSHFAGSLCLSTFDKMRMS